MKEFTIATPRYTIESVDGIHCDVFSKRSNAIKAAIKFGSDYPGTTFLVVRKVNQKSKVIFQFKIDMKVAFADVADAYQGILDTYQDKKNKSRYWRKVDAN